jgi:hypothetical protein
MKHITKEEKAAMVTRPLHRQSPVRIYLMKMQVEDIIFISEQEWTWKTATPAYLCRRVEEKTPFKFEVEKVMNSTPGWVITRTH